MVNSIKLSPETVEAIKRNREKQAEQRRQDTLTRQIREKEARQAHNAFIGYLCVLSFLAGLYVGALLIGG